MLTIIDAFQVNVARFGNKTCLKYKSAGKWRSLSWNEVAKKIEAYSKDILALGVKNGDTIGIISSTKVEWTLIDMAILSAGGVVVPVYSAIPADQIAYILNDAEISVLFVENEVLLEKVKSIRGQIKSLRHIILIIPPPPPLEKGGMGGFETVEKVLTLEALAGIGKSVATHHAPRITHDEAATIIYTSGTTGVQKGVIITHENIMAEIKGLQKIFNLGPDEIILAFLPLAHVLGRTVQFYQLAQGCQTAYAESIDTVPKNLLEVRPHMIVAVPRFIEKIYEKINEKINSAGRVKQRIFKWSVDVGKNYSLCKRRNNRMSFVLRLKYAVADFFVFSRLLKALGGRIRFIVSGGAPLLPELAKFFHGAGLLILEGYGLTETLSAVTVNRFDDFHLGTVGKPLDGVSVKISDDGEILVKGGMVFKGYHKLPEETFGAFTKDGWFKTGDIGEFSKDGFLRITDRKKDIIITAGGKNIAPQAIETLLEKSPYISHAAIFGDGKKYISAVISLNFDVVKSYADKNGIAYSRQSELAKDPKIIKLIEKIIEEKNGQLSQFETIKKFAILDHDFTIETGELTPTMKVRRKLIEEKYKDILNKLY